MANCVDIAKRNELLGRRQLYYECKKCKKRFESFQALGGHATSHKNKLNMVMSTNGESLHVNNKKHECSICGHMRKYRDELNQIEQNKKIKLEENLIKSGELVESTKRSLNLDLNLSIWE
ncbi:hypothetical protein R3W88_030523 [Solanum pinnatisectum]|uniref:C2H2-type domain-containing protein n=1 Tax=Solanum pinnatisectum TaxID=50273 RepID=A0AAV9K8C5_9SOLN|nr:hypothetical protein R3W88_030523 [Solanum pinnatisectum]